MYAVTINKKKVMNLKENRVGYIGGLAWRGKGEML